MHPETAHRGCLLYVALGFLGLDLPPAAMPSGLRALHDSGPRMRAWPDPPNLLSKQTVETAVDP